MQRGRALEGLYIAVEKPTHVHGDGPDAREGAIVSQKLLDFRRNDSGARFVTLGNSQPDEPRGGAGFRDEHGNERGDVDARAFETFEGGGRSDCRVEHPGADPEEAVLDLVRHGQVGIAAAELELRVGVGGIVAEQRNRRHHSAQHRSEELRARDGRERQRPRARFGRAVEVPVVQ